MNKQLLRRVIEHLSPWLITRLRDYAKFPTERNECYMTGYITDLLMGSRLILSITLLGGRKPFHPVMIRDGLSKETIAALKADLARSYNTEIAFKPEGA